MSCTCLFAHDNLFGTLVGKRSHSILHSNVSCTCLFAHNNLFKALVGKRNLSILHRNVLNALLFACTCLFAHDNLFETLALQIQHQPIQHKNSKNENHKEH